MLLKSSWAEGLVPALFRGDWVMTALTSSVDQPNDRFEAEGNVGGGGLCKT